LGTQATQVLLVHTSPVPQGAHDFLLPHPRSIGSHPVAPASRAAAHVVGVQHAPFSQISLFGHDIPQVRLWPHPLLTCPQLEVPQLGGVHAVQTPLVQCVPVAQLPQAMLPLPQAFATVPHNAPASPAHSGGGAVHTPPLHICPLGQEQAIVCPHPLVIVPQSWVRVSGAQVRGAHCPASCAPAGTHWLPMQAIPALHPPQLIATPHPSSPIAPQRPVHTFG
jgi:hypothetical protein